MIDGDEVDSDSNLQSCFNPLLLINQIIDSMIMTPIWGFHTYFDAYEYSNVTIVAGSKETYLPWDLLVPEWHHSLRLKTFIIRSDLLTRTRQEVVFALFGPTCSFNMALTFVLKYVFFLFFMGTGHSS